MTETRLLAAWLRPLVGLIALAGVLALSACGGGSGAPNNPYAPGPTLPGPLVVLPSTATVFSGVPTTLTVTGGVGSYSAYSSNSAILPVAQAVAGNTVLILASNVAVDTAVTITVQDAVGALAKAELTVRAAPLLSELITITPNGDCSVGIALCSGGTGTATVKVTAPGGAGIPGRQVRFDVVFGAYALQTTNPAQPLASTVTLVTDQNGNVSAGIVVNVTAPTQIATIRATDVTSGNQVTGNFLIQQVTDGSQILSVIPTGTVTIDGPDANTCSSGVVVQYYIYGGTPPYTVKETFPGAVVLSTNLVLTNGGGFTATTTGACFVNMQYAITDATGRTIPGGSSPLLTNQVGKATTTPPSTMTVAPATISNNACTGKTFQLVVIGGVAPYNVTAAPSTGVIVPSPVLAAGTPVPVSGLATGSGDTIITFVDSSSPKQSASAKITCP
ncbi:MAG: hypothetical protein ABI569_04250 [Casimicrobiaceae bacterium]